MTLELNSRQSDSIITQVRARIEKMKNIELKIIVLLSQFTIFNEKQNQYHRCICKLGKNYGTIIYDEKIRSYHNY